ncbi:Influenza virus NS1A-binding protein homolog A [Linum grandiflorum]
MAGGRKAGKPAAKVSPNIPFSYSTRNLSKTDLAGVIFGCKHYTFNECLSKELFGLPAIHISYVQKIDPGLPLFLFNYSDRKLHGIFEAASQGKMNIDPYAWLDEGVDYTPYPAQVKIKTVMLCHPLLESQFAPIIIKNYYANVGQNHFWFELDQAQTRTLLSLFSSLPANPNVSLPKQVPYLNTLKRLPEASGLGKRKEDGQVQNQQAMLSTEFLGLTVDGETSFVQPKPWAALFKPKSTSDTGKEAECATQKPWAALFRSQTNSNVHTSTENDGNMSMPYSYSKLDSHPVHQSNVVSDKSGNADEALESHPMHQSDVWWDMPGNADEALESHPRHQSDVCWDMSGNADEALESHPMHQSDVCWDKSGNAHEPLESGWELGWDSLEKDISTAYSGGLPCADTSHTRQETEDVRYVADNSSPGWSSSSVSANLDGDANRLEVRVDNEGVNAHEPEQVRDDTNLISSAYESVDGESFSEGTSDTRTVRSKGKDTGSAGGMIDLEMQSAGAFSMSQLQTRLEGLEFYQAMQDKKISSLEQELVRSKLQIQQLKSMMESAVFPAIHPTEESDDEVDTTSSISDKLVLVAGGFNGSSWLPDLDSYSLSNDTMKPLSPMLCARSYASAAKFNEELYLIGGLRGEVFFDQVESYNPATDQWTLRPSLNRRKGSLAAISLDSKIFILGGGNETGCFAEVEMFDADAGRWILAQSMLQKRFSPAAAEIDGVLYVVGGYDGNTGYLNSVERFDPREHSWTRLQDMNTRRSCHCVAVLNEKLYAFGGYDGSSMVASMEVLDPRTGSWINKESMNTARSYFGSFVMDNTIHVFGGLDDESELPNTVEYYKEGQGWEVSKLKGIGKRCFLSTAVF